MLDDGNAKAHCLDKVRDRSLLAHGGAPSGP
jgi:hypothetical protein